jgi:hypothetical protein
MEETKAIKKREITGTTAKEPKQPRVVRRLQKAKKEFLDMLLHAYFTKRSTFADPNGEEAVESFDTFNHEWIKHCKNFNSRREPIKLRYEAFTEAVEFYTKMEKDQVAQTAESNKAIGFQHWLRRSKVWRTRPLTSVWYWLRALGNKEKWTSRWKVYYTSCVTQKA